jgi:hypothetical protein
MPILHGFLCQLIGLRVETHNGNGRYKKQKLLKTAEN